MHARVHWVLCASAWVLWYFGSSGLRCGLEKRWACGHQGAALAKAGLEKGEGIPRPSPGVHLWLRKKYALTDRPVSQTRLDSTRLDLTRLDQARLDPSLLGQLHLPAQVAPCLPKTCQVFQDAREGACQGPGIEGWISLGIAPQGASCPIRVVSHWRIAHCEKMGLISLLTRPQRHARGPCLAGT